MKKAVLSPSMLKAFKEKLIKNEKSAITIEKYLRDAGRFIAFCAERAIDKETVIAFKDMLAAAGYKVSSINSMLSSVNAFLSFLGLGHLRIKLCKVQRRIYTVKERELSKQEYLRLLDTTGGNRHLRTLMQTICATGIRISELRFFTYEALCAGEVVVNCKNKTRIILIPTKLRKLLMRYCKDMKIKEGIIFRTRNRRPIDRSNVWRMMKRLCEKAGVARTKVFPHNLRKLFAKIFYKSRKDIATLADLLGHSSINTTRIYIMTTVEAHQREIDRMGLVIDEKSTA